MGSRQHRARIAAETVEILRAGEYLAPSGRTVSIADAVRAAVEASVLVTPHEAASLIARAAAGASSRTFTPTFAVRNETTLAAAHRLVQRLGAQRVAALNFASARNPGGGFLGGSQAQEESLARATALYACLERHMAYYEANRAEPSLLYTDHMIISPRVPVLRDEDDRLLEEPWEVTVITSPAPNSAALAREQPDALRRVEATLRHRMEMVLSAAVLFEQTALVLGAWGCGVFGNDPALVARLFGEALLHGPCAKAFEHVAFAVLDRAGATLTAFENVFGRGTRP